MKALRPQRGIGYAYPKITNRRQEAQQMEYIAFDSHKRYTLASVVKLSGGQLCELRVAHEPCSIRQFLSRWTAGSPVAVETVGNQYWIVDEIEKAGMLPRLVHARKAKLMMAMVNKTDKLNARGLNRLQRSGSLPTVWRELLQQVLAQLPPHTRFATEQLLAQLDTVEQQIQLFELRIRGFFAPAPELASYAGTTPKVHASGGKLHYGQMRPDVNRYLKWAFLEAANVICLNHKRFPQRHVHRLYQRVASRKGYQKAIGAVARHLAEAPIGS